MAKMHLIKKLLTTFIQLMFENYFIKRILGIRYLF